MIHNLSNRTGKPFIVVNCPAIPEDILETELLGYREVHLQKPTLTGKAIQAAMAARCSSTRWGYLSITASEAAAGPAGGGA